MRIYPSAPFDSFEASPVAVPSPFRAAENEPSPGVPPSAWPSSTLETLGSPGRNASFASAYGRGPRGQLQPPSEAVRAMAQQGANTTQRAPQVDLAEFNALGIANVPELRHVNLPNVAVAAARPQQVGLGLQHVDNLPQGAQTIRPDRRSNLPTPEEPVVEFRPWGRHQRRHAERGVHYVSAEHPFLQLTPRPAAVSLQPETTRDFTLTLEDLDAQMSSPFIPLHPHGEAQPSPQEAYTQVLRTAYLGRNQGLETPPDSPLAQPDAPEAPRLESREWR